MWGVSSQIPGSNGARRGALPNGRRSGGGPRLGFGSTVFGIRSGEGALAWLFFLDFLILTTVHFAAKTVRQATFIDALGAENLPWVYLAVAAISLPVLVIYSRAAARFKLPMLILGGTLLHVFGLVLFFYLFGLGNKWVAAFYYVWLGMAFAIAVSQFWTHANQVFDAVHVGARVRGQRVVAPAAGDVLGPTRVRLIEGLGACDLGQGHRKFLDLLAAYKGKHRFSPWQSFSVLLPFDHHSRNEVNEIHHR